MANPYAPPQAASTPRQSKEIANDPLLKRYRRLNVLWCRAIGVIAIPMAALICLVTVLHFGTQVPGVPWWGISVTAAIGSALLVGASLSLARRRAAAFGTAFVSALLLIYLGVAWLYAPHHESVFLSNEQVRTVLTIAALHEVLIIVLAALIVSTTVKIGRRRTELADSGE